MKRTCIAALAIHLLLSVLTVPAGAQVISGFDTEAASVYIQSWNSRAEGAETPLSAYEDNPGVLMIKLSAALSGDGQNHTAAEALTQGSPHVRVFYSAATKLFSVSFIQPGVTDALMTAEAYGDNGMMPLTITRLPDGNVVAYAIGITAEQYQTLSSSATPFLRLVGDGGTAFVQLTRTASWDLLNMMDRLWACVSYAGTDSASYLDASLLPAPVAAKEEQTSPAAAKGPDYSFRTDYEGIERSARSCYLLEVYDERREIATGSGFVCFEKGILVTNAHVIEDAAYIIPYGDDGYPVGRLTEIIAVDEKLDIAILAFPDGNADALPSSEGQVMRGQPVVAIGSPEGILNTVSTGNISNVVDDDEWAEGIIQFTASISHGSSGGAVFNDAGEVIGISSATHREGNDIYYAVPIRYARELLEKADRANLTSIAAYNGLETVSTASCSLNVTQTSRGGREGLMVVWKEVSGAKSYTLYRKSGENQQPRAIAEITAAGSGHAEYFDSNVQEGVSYTYYIEINTGSGSPATSETVTRIFGQAAASGNNPEPSPSGGQSSSGGTSEPAQTADGYGLTAVKASRGGRQGMLVVWNEQKDAASYSLYCNGEVLTVVPATGSGHAEAFDSGAVDGQTYEYTVVTVGKDGTSEQSETLTVTCGKSSGGGTASSGTAAAAAPGDENVKLSVTRTSRAGRNGLLAVWKEVSGAGSYTVYRIAGGGTAKAVGTVDAAGSGHAEYFDADVENGVKYTYFLKINGGSLDGRMTRSADKTYTGD